MNFFQLLFHSKTKKSLQNFASKILCVTQLFYYATHSIFAMRCIVKNTLKTSKFFVEQLMTLFFSKAPNRKISPPEPTPKEKIKWLKPCCKRLLQNSNQSKPKHFTAPIRGWHYYQSCGHKKGDRRKTHNKAEKWRLVKKKYLSWREKTDNFLLRRKNFTLRTKTAWPEIPQNQKNNVIFINSANPLYKHI